jgi:hypothetical protein
MTLYRACADPVDLTSPAPSGSSCGEVRVLRHHRRFQGRPLGLHDHGTGVVCVGGFSVVGLLDMRVNQILWLWLACSSFLFN